MKSNIDLFLGAIFENSEKLKQVIQDGQQKRLPYDQLKALFNQTLLENVPKDSDKKELDTLLLHLQENNKKATKVYDLLEKVFPNMKRNGIIDCIDFSQKNKVIFKSFLDKVPISDKTLEELMKKDDNIAKAFKVFLDSIISSIEKPQTWVNSIQSKNSEKGLQK